MKTMDGKYKAGDRVTIELDKSDARNLNNESGIIILEILGCQIIAHEPAPPPINTFIHLYSDGSVNSWRTIEDAKEIKVPYGVPTIKLTYCRVTKEVKAEVVE